jgi:hypothetical protein
LRWVEESAILAPCSDGDFYSFWVSQDKDGASNGYNAAGGPGFDGGTDTSGRKAYNKSRNFLFL